MTCQQLDCMQRHAEGHGNLWHKQAIVLNENHHQQQLHEQQQQQQQQLILQQQQQQQLHQKTDTNLTLANQLILSTSSSTATNVTALTDTTTTTNTTTTSSTEVEVETETSSMVLSAVSPEESTTSCGSSVIKGAITLMGTESTSPLPLLAPTSTSVTISKDIANNQPIGVTQKLLNTISNSSTSSSPLLQTTAAAATNTTNALNSYTSLPLTSTSSASTHTAAATVKASNTTKPNDWVVIPVFADIVKLALAGREDCLQR